MFTLFTISPNIGLLGSDLGIEAKIGRGVVARVLALPRKFSLFSCEVFLHGFNLIVIYSVYLDFCLYTDLN